MSAPWRGLYLHLSVPSAAAARMQDQRAAEQRMERTRREEEVRAVPGPSSDLVIFETNQKTPGIKGGWNPKGL